MLTTAEFLYFRYLRNGQTRQASKSTYDTFILRYAILHMSDEKIKPIPHHACIMSKLIQISSVVNYYNITPIFNHYNQ